MRAIAKGPEPQTVTTVRCANTTDLTTNESAREAFDQLDKPALRERLAEEQHGLCAFCMRRIDDKAIDDRGEPTMKIAHRTPIAADPALALTWTNLLGSCDGGQRSKGRYWTCDAAQGETPLTVDPTKAESVARLRYERRGGRTGLFITSDAPPLREDVDAKTANGRQRPGTLALNVGDLPELREKAWDAFRETHRRLGKASYGKPALRAFLPKWLAKQGSRHPEFVGVVEVKLA